MFDYYAMPTDWPGREETDPKPWNERASTVEERLRSDIAAAMGNSFNPRFFVPYIQLHEFEALAFSDVGVLASVLAPIGKQTIQSLKQRFGHILDKAGHPEAINDGFETCPSRRISNIVPAYKKRALGPIVTNRIGLDVLRARCTHFGEWLTRLENLDGARD